MSKPHSFFRGSELPRMLLLLAILLGGMVFVWKYTYYNKLNPEPKVVAKAPLAPIVPDKSPEFETVEDKTEIRLRDMAAYEKLLKQVDALSPAELSQRSRSDVLSIQLWERPERYRGVPLQIVGTVLRVMSYESKLSRTGRLYEAWMVTSDSQRNFYVCVFDTPPKNFPVGDNLSERIVFNGYFLKLMKYQSGKDLGFYTAPVLIGRVGWSTPAAERGRRTSSPAVWMAVAVGLMFLVSSYRWMTGLRRSLSTARRTTSHGHVPPNEAIAPEELNAWVENVASQNEDDADVNVDDGDDARPPRNRD